MAQPNHSPPLVNPQGMGPQALSEQLLPAPRALPVATSTRSLVPSAWCATQEASRFASSPSTGYPDPQVGSGMNQEGRHGKRAGLVAIAG